MFVFADCCDDQHEVVDEFDVVKGLGERVLGLELELESGEDIHDQRDQDQQ
jgi:hypothetical protein